MRNMWFVEMCFVKNLGSPYPQSFSGIPCMNVINSMPPISSGCI